MLFSLAVLAARHSGNAALMSADDDHHQHQHHYCLNGTPGGVEPSVRAVVSVTCCLSMIGASLIILSYVLIKDIRTKPREILLNLSLMDFMVAAANLSGVSVDFDSYFYNESYVNDTQEYHVMDVACKAQAFVAMYATISSIVWTNCIAVYIFFHIMLEGKLSTVYTMFSFYLLGYGLPLILNLWFLLTGKLGYSPYGSSGWCSVIVSDMKTGKLYPFTLVFANDIWFYLTITLVPLIYISLKFYLHFQLQASRAILMTNAVSTVHKVEMKLIFIPIIFLLLRMWSLLLTVLEIEAGIKLHCSILLIFIHLGGIGDSGQGFANAILFVFFTPKVRRYFLRLLLCHCLWRKSEQSTDIQSNRKIYGTVPSNSDYRSEGSDSRSASEYISRSPFMNKSITK